MPIEEYWASNWLVRYDIRRTHEARGIPLPYPTQCPPELRHLVPKGKHQERRERRERRQRAEAQRLAQAGAPQEAQVDAQQRQQAQANAQDDAQAQEQRQGQQQEGRQERGQSPEPDGEGWEEVRNRGKGGPSKGRG